METSIQASNTRGVRDTMRVSQAKRFPANPTRQVGSEIERHKGEVTWRSANYKQSGLSLHHDYNHRYSHWPNWITLNTIWMMISLWLTANSAINIQSLTNGSLVSVYSGSAFLQALKEVPGESGGGSTKAPFRSVVSTWSNFIPAQAFVG